jgi:hypothetical protein
MRELAAILVLFPLLCAAQQTKATAPSKEEVSELLAKADEKVTAFEEALKQVRPDLEEQQPEMFKNYLNAAAVTHTLIKSLRSNGPSAYALVALITALDDVTLDASKTATMVLLTSNEGIKDARTQAKLTSLWSAQNALRTSPS